MNKKILLIFLLAIVILPLSAYAVNSLPTMADKAKDAAMSVGEAIVVIGWIIAGILYLTAGGAPEKTGIAKKALIAAVIGTVIVVIAKAGYPAIKTFIESIVGT